MLIEFSMQTQRDAIITFAAVTSTFQATKFMRLNRQPQAISAGMLLSISNDCRLITHAYCAQLQHLTNGSKLGAQIAEKRNLFAKKAVNMYRRYPHHIIGKVSLVCQMR